MKKKYEANLRKLHHLGKVLVSPNEMSPKENISGCRFIKTTADTRDGKCTVKQLNNMFADEVTISEAEGNNFERHSGYA